MVMLELTELLPESERLLAAGGHYRQDAKRRKSGFRRADVGGLGGAISVRATRARLRHVP
jgi:hypothetical protein